MSKTPFQTDENGNKLFSESDIDRFAEKRNRKELARIAELEPQIAELRAKIESDEREPLDHLHARLETEQGKAAALDDEWESFQAEQSQRQRLESETAYYKGEHETAERASAINSAAAKHGAIDSGVLEAVLSDVATSDIDATVAGMRDNRAEFGSLFRSEAARGIGESTNPPPQSIGGKPSRERLKNMSTEEFMRIRAERGREFFFN